jgi:transposase
MRVARVTREVPGLSSTQGGRAVGDHSEVFVALDVAKGKNAVAIAEGGRRGEVRYLGEIENSRDATRKLVAKLC